MATDAEWSKAYAQQAAADWDCWLLLNQQPDVPECQRLHFLQMACEKVVKAHLFALGGHNADLVRRTHAVIRKNLKQIVTHTLNRLEQQAEFRSVSKLIQQSIENLARR